MKINERTLLHIAQSSENPVDNSGWLLKLSEDKRTFQKRWCVLKENIFFYYENKNDTEPLGVIILEGYRVEIVEVSKNENDQGENSQLFAFTIDFGVSQIGLHLKSYTFAADNHVNMEKWVKSLSCASYDYLKMVVSELQHRLDELSILKMTEPVKTGQENETIGQFDDLNKDFKRFNPFDSIETEQAQNTTSFLRLHEHYGKMLRYQFGKPNSVREEAENAG